MLRSSASATIATLGIDLGKNSFHLVGQDERGAIVLRLKLSRAQLSQRLANIPPCLIGMEACAGAHHIGRQLQALGHVSPNTSGSETNCWAMAGRKVAGTM